MPETTGLNGAAGARGRCGAYGGGVFAFHSPMLASCSYPEADAAPTCSSTAPPSLRCTPGSCIAKAERLGAPFV
jgi:hypothetical protein